MAAAIPDYDVMDLPCGSQTPLQVPNRIPDCIVAPLSDLFWDCTALLSTILSSVCQTGELMGVALVVALEDMCHHT